MYVYLDAIERSHLTNVVAEVFRLCTRSRRRPLMVLYASSGARLRSHGLEQNYQRVSSLNKPHGQNTYLCNLAVWVLEARVVFLNRPWDGADDAAWD